MPDLEISAEDLRKKQAAGEPIYLLDVRAD